MHPLAFTPSPPRGKANPPNTTMKSPACKSLLRLSEQLFLGWEQKGGGGWLARHRMFAICTMLSSVNTAANERAAICTLRWQPD